MNEQTTTQLTGEEWLAAIEARANDYDGTRNDAAFMAAARADVPALVAEVRELLLHTRTLEALVAEQAAEIDRLRAELAQAVEHRDHWHAELMCADARILELQRQVPKGGARGRARLDASAAAEAEATHWRRLGMTPPVSAEDPRDAAGGAR